MSAKTFGDVLAGLVVAGLGVCIAIVQARVESARDRLDAAEARLRAVEYRLKVLEGRPAPKTPEQP